MPDRTVSASQPYNSHRSSNLFSSVCISSYNRPASCLPLSPCRISAPLATSTPFTNLPCDSCPTPATANTTHLVPSATSLEPFHRLQSGKKLHCSTLGIFRTRSVVTTPGHTWLTTTCEAGTKVARCWAKTATRNLLSLYRCGPDSGVWLKCSTMVPVLEARGCLVRECFRCSSEPRKVRREGMPLEAAVEVRRGRSWRAMRSVE